VTRIAVTGGSGFIGSHVVDALVGAGHDVVVVDRRAPHRADAEYAGVDLLDREGLARALRGAVHVFHLAAIANVDHVHERPVDAMAQNVIGTMHVLEAARTHSCERVHLASTVWVYNEAPGTRPAEEETPFYLNGGGHVYTSSKMAAEMACHNYRTLYGVPYTILRYGIPYGPRMRDELLIPRLIRRARAGLPLEIAGDGSQFRRFLYVEDLARAHLCALDASAADEVYNLEGARRVTVLEVAELVRELVGGGTVEFVPGRSGDFVGRDACPAKAERELDWRPQVDFEDGLRRTVAWFSERWPAPATATA
jgi:UDP-glucose 4-epimerase